MLESLRARQPATPLRRIAWWYVVQSVCFVWFNIFYRYRAWGLHNIPRTGPVLLLSNHQSYFDPLVVAIGAHHRQFYAMARSTLFRNPVFSWLIRSINAFAVHRGKTDMAAMRQSIRILQQGQALLLFPEGTRTSDGRIKPFAKGTLLLIKRANPVIVPVAVEGAYDVWPKGRLFPRTTGKISVAFGKPIQAEQLVAMGEDKGLELVRREIEAMRRDLADRMT